jgi:hypothetical protein
MNFTRLIEWCINDVLEDVNGRRYLIGWRNNKIAIIHQPSCGSEREGECKFDYLAEVINSQNDYDLQKIVNYDETPHLLDDY